ncbi:MAG: B12-binding domain-containing radical SAM protein [Gammaproteobacteria bacterium]|nr:B12-binding domain-containing radical SAM protein [Gammaproteobacteria bacterium]
MLSILLGHSYFLRLDHKQWQRAKPYPPLATLQVAALLRRLGHEVRLFDAMLAAGVAEYARELERVRPDLVLIYEDNYNFLSKMCLATMRAAAVEMITSARSSGARVIVGGSDATDAPDAYMAAGAEVVLHGEGLEALEALVSRLDVRPDIDVADLIHGLSGVASQASTRATFSAAEPHRGSRRKQAEPPSPAWDLVDIERYRTVWREAHGYFSLNMAASRGCSFRCAWCAKPIWGSQYLQRGAADVAAEMTQLKRQFGPDHIWFADDIFGFRADWVGEFARAVHAADGAVPFTIQTRADLVTERMAAALRDAGCREAWLGAESGSQRVLDAMNKGTTVGQIHAARERLGAVGIRVGFFIQLGYLGEELEDVLATRRLIEVARPDDVGVSVAYPLPGTPFHELVKARLQDKTHWQESGDLVMMFPGTYTTEFYRAVRDLLHEEVTPTPSAGRQALRSRWHRLIKAESRFRHSKPLTPEHTRSSLRELGTAG